jgi:D-alanine-D-alanine ligase
MPKVLVIYGGSSDERDVSLRSGASINNALKSAGYETRFYDPGDSVESLSEAVKGCDVAFPALHGLGGEDGTIQLQLERLHIPYVGSAVSSSELCFDKWNYRDLLAKHNIPMARGELVDASLFQHSAIAQKPYVLKPPKGGSSIDTILAHTPNTVDQEVITSIFAKHRQLLLEELIQGTELTIGILGDIPLPVIEIIPPAGKDFDYENKYNGATQELCPPEHVSSEIQKTAQELALRVHQLTGCRDFSRTDIMCDKDGNLFLLETNTIPGMTDQSLFPKMARTAGIEMPELCKQLVEMALSR